jgi:hypothetical protein
MKKKQLTKSIQLFCKYCECKIGTQGNRSLENYDQKTHNKQQQHDLKLHIRSLNMLFKGHENVQHCSFIQTRFGMLIKK